MPPRSQYLHGFGTETVLRFLCTLLLLTRHPPRFDLTVVQLLLISHAQCMTSGRPGCVEDQGFGEAEEGIRRQHRCSTTAKNHETDDAASERLYARLFLRN